MIVSILSLIAVVQPAPATTGELEVSVSNVRNARGVIHACLTANTKSFPDCSRDPAALKRTVRADVHQLRFAGIPRGVYALTVVHDENANEKFDTTLGIPREGFGFSRNPKIRFGAPKFNQVSMELGSGLTRQSVRMQYLL